MMREAVLVNGDYAVRVCHAYFVRQGRAVAKVQIMRAEHVHVFVKKKCRVASSERRRDVVKVDQFNVISGKECRFVIRNSEACV